MQGKMDGGSIISNNNKSGERNITDVEYQQMYAHSLLSDDKDQMKLSIFERAS